MEGGGREDRWRVDGGRRKNEWREEGETVSG